MAATAILVLGLVDEEASGGDLAAAVQACHSQSR